MLSFAASAAAQKPLTQSKGKYEQAVRTGGEKREGRQQGAAQPPRKPIRAAIVGWAKRLVFPKRGNGR